MKAKRFGIALGIALVLPMMVHYGVSTFTPKPQWKDYHKSYSPYYSEDYKDATPEEKKKMKENQQKQDDAYRNKQKVFQRTLFYVAVPVGIIAIIVGGFLSMHAIGAGLIFGGIFTCIDGYCWYWSELPDGMRFISLLIAFTVMIVVGYTKLNYKKEASPQEVK
tara:strand:+ start:57 stop:548 length:492 start_codon:yes stop_codon:yes gene_type:complete